MRISDWSSDVCSSDLDIRVSDEKRATIYETLGLINEQLWLGHFELWSNSGLVLFRNGALLGSGETLSLEQAQTLIETALDECERFYPVFQFVLWGGKTPQEAISASLIETRGERSEERRGGKDGSVRLDLGGRRIMKKK